MGSGSMDSMGNSMSSNPGQWMQIAGSLAPLAGARPLAPALSALGGATQIGMYGNRSQAYSDAQQAQDAFKANPKPVAGEDPEAAGYAKLAPALTPEQKQTLAQGAPQNPATTALQTAQATQAMAQQQGQRPTPPQIPPIQGRMVGGGGGAVMRPQAPGSTQGGAGEPSMEQFVKLLMQRGGGGFGR